MPRPNRAVDDRLVYHVTNCGNNRAPVFHDDDDYTAFLQSIIELKTRRPFELYGYCLMPNHVHLLIRTFDTPISRVMQGLLVAHTHRHHRVHGSSGHVWQGRFKSPVVQEDDHLMAVLRHVEANPIRSGLVSTAGEYPWSSFDAHGLGLPDESLDPIAAYDELAKTPAVRRRRWSAYVHETPDPSELLGVRRSLQTGLPFGDTEWVEALGRRLGLDLESRPRGRPRKVPLVVVPEPVAVPPRRKRDQGGKV